MKFKVQHRIMALSKLLSGFSLLLLLQLLPVTGSAAVTVTASASPDEGIAPLAVDFSASFQECIPLDAPTGIIEVGSGNNKVTVVSFQIANPGDTAIQISRIDLTTSNPNRLVAVDFGGTVPLFVSPAYGSNSSNFIVWFDDDPAHADTPADPVVILPAGTSLTLTLTYASPLVAGSKDAFLTFYDENRNVVGSTGTDQQATTYSWDFGDGNPPDTAANPGHTYLTEGVYTATVTATCNGVTVTDTVTITVGSPIDHYSISFPLGAPGVTCERLAVRITAHDATHAGAAPADTTRIILSTIPAADSWDLRSGGNPGSFTDLGSGQAEYIFDGTETFVEFWLTETTATTAPHIDIDITDGSAADIDGDATEDPPAQFEEAGFSFQVNGAAGSIGTQIAGKLSTVAPGSQALSLRGIRTNPGTGACQAALVGTQAVNLAFACNSPDSCVTANGVTIVAAETSTVQDNPGGGPISYTTVNMDFDASGIAPFSFSYADAGRITLHAQYTLPNSVVLNGQSNAFAVRPFGYDVQVTGNPAATGPAGAVFKIAGETFTTTVRAVQWQAVDDDGVPSGVANDGIPDGHDDTDPANNANLADNSVTPNYGREVLATEADISLSAVLDQPSAGNHPGLTGGTGISSFTAGSGNSATVRYDEVGIIEITAALTDNDYLGAGSLAGRSGHVGRFYPDHFSLVSSTLTNRSNMACAPPAPVFTYMDEMLNVIFMLQANNVSGNPTENYTGAFAFLPIDVPSMVFGAVDTAAPTPLSGRVTVISAIGAWSNGQATVAADFGVNRVVSEDGPFEQFNLGIAPVDPVDGVIMDPFNLDVDDNGIADHTAVNNTAIRFGRLFIGSGFGSELLPVTVPLQVEYYDGAVFVVHADDNCTGFSSTDLVLTNTIEAPQTDGDILIAAGGSCPEPGPGCTQAAIANNPVAAGVGGLSFSPPEAGNTGYADITVDLSVASGLDMEWLYYDWDGDNNHDNNPLGRVSFGVFEGEDEFIYIREPW
jgi:MSHA biogenesis protein MshQ